MLPCVWPAGTAWTSQHLAASVRTRNRPCRCLDTYSSLDSIDAWTSYSACLRRSCSLAVCRKQEQLRTQFALARFIVKSSSRTSPKTRVAPEMQPSNHLSLLPSQVWSCSTAKAAIFTASSQANLRMQYSLQCGRHLSSYHQFCQSVKATICQAAFNPSADECRLRCLLQ